MKRLFAILEIAICLLSICSCGKAEDGMPLETDTKEVTAIILSTESVEITMDSTYQITYTILPENALNQELEWKSTDEAIVTVDNNGAVTAIGIGQANIIATCENGIYTTCTVTVKEPSAYDRLDANEKELVDAFVAVVDCFYNAGSTSLKYAYHHSTDNSWAITVSAQNQMGGYSEKDYNLYADGRIEEPILNHVRMSGDYYDLSLVNEAIKELTN